jgi:ADP-ribose pyrophosphatase YjhB (NUDIX family)
MSTEPIWLVWSRKLQSIAQAGLTYSPNAFDLERYHAIRGIAAEIAAQGSGIETSRIENLFMGDEGYSTPKLDVRSAVFQDGKILLVRETMDGGRWTVPGGWIDPGDSPAEAAVRELFEETGFTAKVVKLAAVLDRARHGHPPHLYSIYKLFFICEITGGSPAQSLETGESAFYPIDGLPELSLSRINPEEIKLLYWHAANPQIPTEYD